MKQAQRTERAAAWAGGSGVQGRIVEGEGMAVLTLGAGKAVLVESGSVVFLRGVRWSRAVPGRGWMEKAWNGLRRMGAGLEGGMERLEGPGEAGIGRSGCGRVRVVMLTAADNIVVARGCLTAVAETVDVSVALQTAVRLGRRQRRERIVLQRLTGSGLALLQAGGSTARIELRKGERLEAPVGAVAWFDGTAEFEVRQVTQRRRGVTLLARLTGPGNVVVQASRDDG